MEAKYKIGDIVELNGYPGRVFQVNGFSNFEYLYQGKLIKEIRYILTDLVTKEELIGFEEDIVLKEEHYKYRRKMEEINKMIDEYLKFKRAYEDYMTLYHMFGDETDKEFALFCKSVADGIMKELKNNKGS